MYINSEARLKEECILNLVRSAYRSIEAIEDLHGVKPTYKRGKCDE